MRRSRKQIIHYGIATLILLFSVNIASAESKNISLKVGGMAPAAGAQMFCAKLADIIDRYVEGVNCTVTTSSSTKNPLRVQKKDVDLGFTGVAFQQWAYEGAAKYKKNPCPDIRFLMHVVTVATSVPFVRADSELKSISELSNKKVQLSPKGYVGGKVAKAILEAYGLTKEEIKKNGGATFQLGSSDAVKMLQDKTLDAMCATSGLKTIEGYMLPLETTIGLKILKPDDAHIEKTLSLLPKAFFPVVIKGGTYKNEPKDIKVIGAGFNMVIHKDIPQDTVYKILSAVYDHVEEIHAVGPTWKGVLLKDGLKYSNIPVHPGAAKYFKQKSVVK